MFAQMASGKLLQEVWKFERIHGFFIGHQYMQFKRNVLAELTAGRSVVFDVIRGGCKLEDKDLAARTAPLPRTTVMIQKGFEVLHLRILHDCAVTNLKPDCDMMHTGCLLHFTKEQWGMLYEAIRVQHADWLRFAGVAPRVELPFTLATCEMFEHLEVDNCLPDTICLFDPPLMHIVGISFVSGRPWSSLSESALLKLLSVKMARFNGILKDMDPPTFTNALAAWRSGGEEALTPFLPNLDRDARAVYEGIADLPLVRNTLLSFDQTSGSAAQLAQLQRAAYVTDGHRSSNFNEASHVGNTWAEHLDVNGHRICNDVLVGRMCIRRDGAHNTSFKHNFDPTQCPIPYALQLSGPKDQETSIEQFTLGREWKSLSSKPKPVMNNDPHKSLLLLCASATRS